MDPSAAASPPVLLGNAVLALAAFSLAAWLRPWKQLGTQGPPWPWVALWSLLPLMWLGDRWWTTGLDLPLPPPLSGVVLLVLLAGWPLAVLSLLPAGVMAALLGDLSAADALHRAVWLGLMPATLALGLGALVRRSLPRHILSYLIGRAFAGTWLALLLCSWVEVALQSSPGSLSWPDLLLARGLIAFGEATLTSQLAALLVALHPAWLATYADRLYLHGGRRG